MERSIFAILTLLILALFLVNTAQATMTSENYQIWADVFSIGGSESGASTNYGIKDTIGEGIVHSGAMESTNYAIKAGFREMYPDRSLSFSVSTASVELGDLDETQAKTASHTMTITTNADNGFTLTISGNTLTNKEDSSFTISAIGPNGATSNPGTEQFGINLTAAGTSPIGLVGSGYGTSSRYTFSDGATVGYANGPINETTYTVTYLANISSDTEAGEYSTTLTYTATGIY